MEFKQDRQASAVDTNDASVSRKELARQLRRQAYQKAKQHRANDPRQIAMKEAARQRRRDVYQAIKKRRKVAAADQKAKQKLELNGRRTTERAATDQKLMSLMTRGTSKIPYDIN